MKIEELRIGNWVYHSSGNMIEIDSIYSDVEEDDLQPIPLTKEWLVKFGFEKISEIGDYSNGNMRVILAISKKIYTLKRKRINHVHQLQNLYWCLCGEELTLKTEK